jgi:hypothetical protein
MKTILEKNAILEKSFLQQLGENGGGSNNLYPSIPRPILGLKIGVLLLRINCRYVDSGVKIGYIFCPMF